MMPRMSEAMLDDFNPISLMTNNNGDKSSSNNSSPKSRSGSTEGRS